MEWEEHRLPQIELHHVTKYFINEQRKFAAIDDVSFSINQGEFVFLIGSSGAGKTTLLRLIASHISPDEGTIFVDNQNIGKMRLWRRLSHRRTIGQVWQDSSLVRKKTIGQNLEIVQRALGVNHRIIPHNTQRALSAVGMRFAEHLYPFQLSGGQIKLVELARAMVGSPPILLIDEITANLDHDTGWDIMNILSEINRRGTTVIMATHAKDFVNIMCRRVVTLVSGRVVGDVEKGKYGKIQK